MMKTFTTFFPPAGAERTRTSVEGAARSCVYHLALLGLTLASCSPDKAKSADPETPDSGAGREQSSSMSADAGMQSEDAGKRGDDEASDDDEEDGDDDDADQDDEASLVCDGCDSPNVCIDGECLEGGSPVVETALGSGPGELAVVEGNESETFGPMSFTVNDVGLVVVLDQENGRLAAFRHNALQFELPLESGTYRDVVFFDADHLAVLDVDEDPRIDVIDLDGELTTSVPVLDAELAVTQQRLDFAGHLARRPDGLWLEFQDGQVVRYLDDDGAPASGYLRSLEHHLTGDGEHLVYSQVSEHQLFLGRVTRRGRYTYQKKRHEVADYLLPPRTIASDADGNVYTLIQQSPARGEYEHHLLVFDPRLELIRDIDVTKGMSGNVGMHRNFVVTDSGEIYFIKLRSDSIEVNKY